MIPSLQEDLMLKLGHLIEYYEEHFHGTNMQKM